MIGLSLSMKVIAIGSCGPWPVVARPVNSNQGVDLGVAFAAVAVHAAVQHARPAARRGAA